MHSLQWAAWRGWMAAGSRLSRRLLESRVQSRILARVDQLRLLPDQKLDQCLQRVRQSARKICDSRRRTPISRSEQFYRDVPRMIATRCTPLVQSNDEKIFLDEAVAVGTVLMGESLGIWLHANQIVASLALTYGYIIQLDTGEGKTFVGAMRAFIDHLFGLRTMVVVPNAYLAARDAGWLSPFYETVGMTVACADSTAFGGPKPAAYDQNVCYVSIPQLMADHVNHVICRTIKDWVHCEPESVVIDEIDAVLLDSLSVGDFVQISPDLDVYQEAHLLVLALAEGKHYSREPYLSIAEDGYRFLQSQRYEFPNLSPLSDTEFLFHVRAALEAQHHYRKDVDYIVDNSRVIVIDRQTGRRLQGADLGFGAQQAVETKEGVPLSFEKRFFYTIHPSSVLSRARYLCGMSGSVAAERVTFRAVFGFPIMVIKAEKPSGRRTWPDEFVRDRQAQIEAVIRYALEHSSRGQPVLIGTQTVRDAEEVTARLRSDGSDVSLITAKCEHEEAEVFRQAVRSGATTVAARMAGRGVDIKVERAALDAGGLAVIGMGRFNMRRLDEQFAGRTGRQGEPGDVRFILSLDDELFRSLYIAPSYRRLLRDSIGNNIVTTFSASIRSIQTKIARSMYLRLNHTVMRERLIDGIRTEYEHLRHTLLVAENRNEFILKLLRQVIRDAMDQPSHWIWAAIPASIRILRERAHQEDADDALVGAIADEYENRCLNAGPTGKLREQHILIRCIDFQWAMLYMDWERVNRISSPMHQSLFHDIQFINRRAEVLRSEYAQQAVYYLFCIDQDDVLAECYYWKGTMLPVRSDGFGEPGWGKICVPGDRAYEFSPEGGTPGHEEASEANPTEWPLLLRHVRAADIGSTREPEIERLGLNQNLSFRWVKFVQTLFLIILGGGFVWTIFAWLSISASSVEPPTGVVQALITQTDSILTLSSAKVNPELLICLMVVVLLHYGLQRTPGADTILLMPTAIVFVAIASIWLDGPFWPRMGSASLIGLLLALAQAILRLVGIGLFEGFACVSGLILAFRDQPHDAHNWQTLFAATAILGIMTAFGTTSFCVRSHQGWDHTFQSSHSSERTFVVGAMDDLLPFLIAWLWVTTVGTTIGSALGSYIAVFPSFVPPTATLSAYIFVTVLLGMRRGKWKQRSEDYAGMERSWEGTLVSCNIGLAAGTLAARVRKRNIGMWAGGLSAASGVIIFGASIDAVAVLLTHAALMGIPLGLVGRRLMTQYQGVSDLRDSHGEYQVMGVKPNLSDRIAGEFDRHGGVWVWVPIAVAIAYLLWRV